VEKPERDCGNITLAFLLKVIILLLGQGGLATLWAVFAMLVSHYWRF
jgi:hypothetical protein